MSEDPAVVGWMAFCWACGLALDADWGPIVHVVAIVVHEHCPGSPSVITWLQEPKRVH